MKIAMFTDTYFPQVSGVATSIKILVDALKADGHEVTIFTTSDPDADANYDVDIVRIPSIPFLFFTDRRVVISGMNKAYRIAKEKQFDIVHTHTEFGMGLIGKYVAYRLKIPTIHTYHTMYEKYLHYIANGMLVKPSHVKALSKLFCQHTSGVISPGETMCETLKSYDIASEIRIIPTGVNIPKRDAAIRTSKRQDLQLTSEHVVLLSLSRLAKEKSIDRIISALPTVIKQFDHVRLVIVGDGPARKELEALAEQLGVSSYIIFAGEVPNDQVSAYYQMADMYVNASETETQGLTFLESLVNGLPIIAKKNDYLMQLVRQKELGVLFEQSEQLAQVITDYITYINRENPEFDASVLLEDISSETFKNNVVSFYQDAKLTYQHTKTNTKNPKSNFLNRIWFGKW